MERFECNQEADKIISVHSLDNTHIPCGFLVCNKNKSLLFILLNDHQTEVVARLELFDDLSFVCYLGPQEMQSNLFSHLLSDSSKKLVYKTELSNCLSFLSSYQEKAMRDPNILLKLASSYLQKYNDIEDNDTVSFFIEQLTHLQCPPTQRRYSSATFDLAYQWKCLSTGCYKQLGNTFILPSITTLNRLSSNISSSANVDYLKTRCSPLSEHEKIVILMIDEVYTSEKVELNAKGEFVGIDANGDASKTILTFMIKSLHGKYSDVISLIPIRSLTTDILKRHYDEVMDLVSKFFLVQAISVDNHVINRKFFYSLQPNLNSVQWIVHPKKSDDFLFLLF